MSGDGGRLVRDGSGDWRAGDPQASSAGAGRSQPTFLSRLRKVLAGVRGSGGRKTEGRQASRAPANEHTQQTEEEVQTGLLDAADRRVYQHALSQLHSSQPLAQRLSVLEELCELCRVYNFEDLPAIWAMCRDLLAPEQDKACKDRVVAFIGTLSAGENFDRLGLIRLEMFSIIQEGGTSLGLQLQIKALMYITKNAQCCTPLELEVCELLITWLLSLASDVQKAQGTFAVRNKHKDLLQYTAGFFKFCSAASYEDNLLQLTAAVCAVLEKAIGKEETVEGSDTWTLHRGCLAALDVLVRYTVPPLPCITQAIDTLCRVVNEASFSREAWLVMKNILMGDHFVGAVNRLIDILHQPARGEEALHGTEQLRGAVFVVSMASWGSSRIENMQYPRQSILSALLCAVMSGERVVCYEVLLSIKRLLGKFGSTLRFEWTTIFAIIERICEALDMIAGNPLPSSSSSSKPSIAPSSSIAPRRSTEEEGGSSAQGGRATGAGGRGSMEGGRGGGGGGRGSMEGGKGAAGGRGGVEVGRGGGGGGGGVSVEQEVQALKDVLALVDDLQTTFKFQGLESDYFRVVTRVKGHVSDKVAEAALAYYVQRIHPAHSGWLQNLSEMMQGFYADHFSSTVRVKALEALRELLDTYGLMYEQEITDTAVLPFLHSLPHESDALVWKVAIKVLVDLAMRMQCDRFSSVVELLQTVGDQGSTEALRLAAVRGLLSILPATMRHLPTSRFTSLWNVLLGMLQRTGPATSKTRVEILQLITCMSVTSKYRPRLVRPGEPDVVCPIPIIAHGSGGGKGEAREGSFKGGVERGGHEEKLDATRLFNSLVQIIDSEEDQDVFTVAVTGLVKGLQNRFMFEREDIQGLVGILTLRLRACTWGPRPSANHDYPSQSPSKAQAAESPRTSAKHDSPRTAVKTDSPRPAGKSESVKGMGAGAGGAGPGSASESAAEIRNTNYEAGLKLLGLAIGGWMLVLPGSLLAEAMETFIKGLNSTHNTLPSEAAVPSLSSHPADRPGILKVIRRNGGVASVCINNLALIAVLLPDLTNQHLPRVLDVMEALTDEVDLSQLVLHGVQYMKYIAGQIPKVKAGVSSQLQQRALKVMFEFMNQPRWGGLIANLTHRALALWYLHSNHALRENFVSTVDQCMRENQALKSDPLCAIMLDWLMRNASADIQTSAPPNRDWMEPIFRRPGVKCKAFAFGDSVLSIRSTPLGLVDMASRRPTDMKRWIIYRPLPTQAGKNLTPSIDGILQLLTASLEVSDISTVKVDEPAPDSTALTPPSPSPPDAPHDPTLRSGVAASPPQPLSTSAETSASGQSVSAVPIPSSSSTTTTTAGVDATADASADVGEETARGVSVGARGGEVGGAGTWIECVGAPVLTAASPTRIAPDAAVVAVAAKAVKEKAEEKSQAAERAASGGAAEEQALLTPQGAKGSAPETRAVALQGAKEAAAVETAAIKQLVPHEIPAVDPYVMLMQWLRGPFGDTEFTHTPTELRFNDALERAIRLLDRTPLTFTHKFGILYIAPDQRSEAEFLKNAGGSALYESFVRKLGHYMPLADCADDVFTGGLDKSPLKRDGEIALFWRNSLAQCIFFVGTLMPNEGSGEQVNKKRFIGNTYVKVVYTDSDHWFTLSWLSGQFNLIVIVVAPLEPGYFRLTVHRDPSVPVIGPVTDVVVVPDHAVATVVRRMLIDADIATMIATAGEEHYSSNWQERLKQIRQMLARHALVEEKSVEA